MKGNDHDLVMQFARGTEALALLERLDMMARQATEKKRELIAQHDQAMQMIERTFTGAVMYAVTDAMSQINSLVERDDGDDDDDDDDD
jgi:hypothetical protein